VKALTLYNPWATLKAIDAKKFETRSWSTRYRGPIAIHASVNDKFKELCMKEPFKSALENAGFMVRRSVVNDKAMTDLPFGAVLCICNLVDCLKIRTIRTVKRDGYLIRIAFLETKNSLIEVSGNELVFGNYGPGRYVYVLEDTKRLPEPIPAKGRQGLWNWTPPEGVKLS